MGTVMVRKPPDDLSNMTSEELSVIARSVRAARRGKQYVLPGKKFVIYLRPDWSVHLQACIDRAYQKRMIKNKTPYSFGSWATERVIESVLKDIHRSKQNLNLKDSPD